MTQQEFIEKTTAQVQDLISKAENHLKMDRTRLSKRPAPDKWHALECYEHLNRYSIVYMDFFDEAISSGPARKGDPKRRSGWLGGRSAKSMAPKDIGVRSPMKTFKKMNPQGEEIGSLVIEQFIQQQKTILALFERAQKVDIDKVRSKTTIKFLNFKLGDAIEFFVNHEMRHMLQAERAIRE